MKPIRKKSLPREVWELLEELEREEGIRAVGIKPRTQGGHIKVVLEDEAGKRRILVVQSSKMRPRAAANVKAVAKRLFREEG